MKQIVCEMCGSNKMIKKDGVYECQYCGCQYTVEEARKLMVEGTVKIDESDKVVNWMKLADSAYNNSSWREAYSYYCKVLEVYPEEWQATYRKALSTGWQSTLGNIHATEAVGGISDGVKTLLGSDNTDEYKALGILTIEQDLFAWISAVQSASVNHAAEYTKTLESACYDYYQRSAIMASVIEFSISLLNKYTVMNIEDLDLADGVFNVIIKASSTISTALSSRFRPLVGKKYNSFLQVFVDDYRDVYPTEVASNAYSKLRIATEKMKQEYPQWKHARLLRDDPDYDNKIMYEAALKKKAADDIKSLEAAAALLAKTAGYKDSESLAAECRERILEKKYAAAVEKKNIGKVQALNEAISQFEEIAPYKDSEALANECKEQIEELTTKKTRKRKRLITLGIVAVLVLIIIEMLGDFYSNRKTGLGAASLDMSTSLMQNGRIIPANEAYKLVKNRIMTEVGDDYTFTVLDDHSYGIYKRGENVCTYSIACNSPDGDPSFLPVTSKEYPSVLVVYDCRAGSPDSDRLAKVIGFLTDNETSSSIQPVLQKQIDSLPNKTYPRSYMLSLNKKALLLSETQEGSWNQGFFVALLPECFEYTKLDPVEALYMFFMDSVSEETLTQLSDEQAKYLLDYFTEHELEYFADFDSLVKQSGLNDR